MIKDLKKLKGVKRWTILVVMMSTFILLLQLSTNYSTDIANRYKVIFFTKPFTDKNETKIEQIEAQKIEELKVEIQQIKDQIFEDQKIKEHEIEGQKMEDHKIENQETEDHKLEDEKMEDNKIEDQETEDHKIEDQETEDQKIEDQETEDHKIEDQETEDHKIEDQETEDHKIEDQETEDHKIEDQKIEDHKIEDEKIKAEDAITKHQILTTYSTVAMTTTQYQSTTEDLNIFPDLPGIIHMDPYVHLPPPVPVRPESSEPILAYSQKRDYDIIISQPTKCGRGKKSAAVMTYENFDFKHDIFLLMVVKSSCALRERRDAVRRSWGDEKWTSDHLGVQTRLVFLLGRCTKPELSREVLEESDQFGDLLQWDFHDSFRNLTLKEVLFLQWFSRFCRNVPFIFKGDDDVFVNTRNIVHYLREEVDRDQRKDLFVGSRLAGSPRILDPTWKYYVSYNLFPDKFYPPYVSGGGFLMSSDIAVRLFQASLNLRIFPIDDAFVGTLLKSIGVNPKNDDRFKSWGMKEPDACHLSKIFTFHKSFPATLLRQWQGVNNLKKDQCSV